MGEATLLKDQQRIFRKFQVQTRLWDSISADIVSAASRADNLLPRLSLLSPSSPPSSLGVLRAFGHIRQRLTHRHIEQLELVRRVLMGSVRQLTACVASMRALAAESLEQVRNVENFIPLAILCGASEGARGLRNLCRLHSIELSRRHAVLANFTYFPNVGNAFDSVKGGREGRNGAESLAGRLGDIGHLRDIVDLVLFAVLPRPMPVFV